MSSFMKTLCFAAAVCAGMSASAMCESAELKLTLKADGKLMSESTLKVDGDIVTATTDDEVEEFDVKQMRWRVTDSTQWVTLEESDRWAQASKEKFAKSVASIPEQVRPFIEFTLDPKFERELKGDVLRLTSGKVDYVIEGNGSELHTEAYYRYSILNSYKKAMTQKKLPPYAELKAIEEMRALGYIPRKITIRIPAIPKSPTFETEVTEVKP